MDAGGVPTTAEIGVHSLVVFSEAGAEFSPRGIRRVADVLPRASKVLHQDM